MGHRGRVQFTSVVIAPADQVAEGDRLLATHAAWMEGTHHRSGDNALLSYNVAKGPELSDPSNPESEPTGNTCYIVTEVYETEVGVADHFAQADATWKEYPEMGKWLERCKQVTMVPVAQIVYSLW